MHIKRWITALIAIPFIVWLLYKGGLVFTIFITAVCLVTLWEYFRIVFNKKDINVFGPIPMLGFLFTLIIPFAAYNGDFNIFIGLLALNMILTGMIAMLRYASDPHVLETVSKQVQGVIYIPFLFSSVILIRNGQDGLVWIYFLLVLVFLNDTGALYVGTFLGNHKLAPAVSPGKTIEGALGGLAICITAGIVFKYFLVPAISWGWSILFFIVVALAGIMGDLFESALKRSGKIKDSGAILPGHGGLLDRIDALIFAAPLAYFFKVYVFHIN